MAQEKIKKDPPSTIVVGQLVYTSFKKFGFRMLKSPDTPVFIQKSFVDQIVNARWDPHSPPSADFRAAYLFQPKNEKPCTVLGWLYYDGQDDFGRSGVPYFLAYYLLGEISEEQLQVFLNCLKKGPAATISRQEQAEDSLEPISIVPSLNYEPARLGVDIPDSVCEKSLAAVQSQQPLDWFITQSASRDSDGYDIEVYDTPVPEIVLSDITEELPQRSITLAESSLPIEAETQSRDTMPFEAKEEQPQSDIVLDPSALDVSVIQTLLTELVNKTMGIQGLALISEEGQSIASAFGLDDNSVGILAGSLLYSAQITKQELSWPNCEWITLRGPDNYLMLRTFNQNTFLLIKAAKVPMGLIDGVVKRLVSKLQNDLSVLEMKNPDENQPDILSSMTNSAQGKIGVEQQATQENLERIDNRIDSQDDIPDLLKAVLQNQIPASGTGEDADIEFEEEITYRGRPTSS